MQDCALGREGGPSAPCVEYRYYAGDRINGENEEGGVKIKPSLLFFYRRQLPSGRPDSSKL